MLDGCINGIELNWFQGRIADSAYELERRFNQGDRIVVGANRFLVGNDDVDLETLHFSLDGERLQRERLARVRERRDDEAVRRCLAALATNAADPEINLMESLIDAARNDVTVGEMMNTMAGVFGRYVESASI